MGVAGCAVHRPVLQPVRAEVAPREGFRIDRPVAIVDQRGLRFHGWICRNFLGSFAPRRLRLERLDAEGRQVAVAATGVTLPARPDCTIYDISTDWRLAPGERVRLCASDNGTPCLAAKP